MTQNWIAALFSGGGKSGPQIWLRNSEKTFGFRELTTISSGNPSELTDRCFGGRLYGWGKYQPQIQFSEGGKVIWEAKIIYIRYIRYTLRNAKLMLVTPCIFQYCIHETHGTPRNTPGMQL